MEAYTGASLRKNVIWPFMNLLILMQLLWGMLFDYAVEVVARRLNFFSEGELVHTP